MPSITNVILGDAFISTEDFSVSSDEMVLM